MTQSSLAESDVEDTAFGALTGLESSVLHHPGVAQRKIFEAIRDALLLKLILGEIRVKDAEKVAEKPI